MNVLTRRVAGRQSLVTPMTAHVKHYINKSKEEHRLTQRLRKQLLENAYQSTLETPKVEAWVVTPLTRTPSKTDSGEVGWCRRKLHSERYNKRSHSICSTSPDGDTHGIRNSKSKGTSFRGIKALAHWTEAVNDYKSCDSSKESRKSKKPKVLRPENDRFSTGFRLQYSPFGWKVIAA